MCELDCIADVDDVFLVMSAESYSLSVTDIKLYQYNYRAIREPVALNEGSQQTKPHGGM